MSLLSAAQRQLPCQLPTIKQAAVKGNSHICDLPDGGSLPLPMRFGYLPSLSSSKASVITLFLRPGREMDSLGLWRWPSGLRDR